MRLVILRARVQAPFGRLRWRESEPDVNFTAAGLRRGYLAAQPLALGVFVYGVTFGLLARNAGLSIIEAVLMSATVYSGSAQTATVSGIAAGAGIGASVVTILMLNARYLLYGAAWRPWLGQASRCRPTRACTCWATVTGCSR